jgi:hypothetical protein
MRVESSGMREMGGEEGEPEIEESSSGGGVDESTGLRKEEIGGRSYVEDDSAGRERFLFEARLF